MKITKTTDFPRIGKGLKVRERIRNPKIGKLFHKKLSHNPSSMILGILAVLLLISLVITNYYMSYKIINPDSGVVTGNVVVDPHVVSNPILMLQIVIFALFIIVSTFFLCNCRHNF